MSATTLRVLSAREADAASRICDRLVPGSAGIGVADYVDRVAAGLLPAGLSDLRRAIGELEPLADRADELAAAANTPAFGRLRALAVQAYYGDYLAPGNTGPTGHEVIGFAPPQALRLRKDWSFLDRGSD